MKRIIYLLVIATAILFSVPVVFSYTETQPRHIPFMTDDGVGGGEGGGPYQYVKVQGRQLLVDFDMNGVYEPYFIKGVAYSPTPAGVFSSDWGICEYCATSSECFYSGGIGDPNDHFSCSAEQPDATHPTRYGGPLHPWGGQQCGPAAGPYPIKCTNLFDRGDVDLERDFQNIIAMNANTIRTYARVTPGLLAKANQYGLKIIAGYEVGRLKFAENGDLLTDTQVIVNDFKDYVSHITNDPNFSSVLFIAIGNENNFSYYSSSGGTIPPGAPKCLGPQGGISVPLTAQMRIWYALVNQMACAAHSVQGPNYTPIALVNGEIGDVDNIDFGTTDNDMACLDIWGANIYRGDSYGDLFSTYEQKSEKPFWISETGVDVLQTNDYYETIPHSDPLGPYYDPDDVEENQDEQAAWMGGYWDEIANNFNLTIGATFFEYSDEYWKGNGRDTYSWDPLTKLHNNAGQCFSFTPTPGMMPDGFYNQEWFGIMGIQENGLNPDIMTPRQAYFSLADRFACTAAAPFYAGSDNGKSCDGSQACCNSSSLKAKNGYCVNSCRFIRPPLKPEPVRPAITEN